MVSIFIDYKLQRFQREIKYAFSFILQSLGYGFSFITDTGQLKPNDILVVYGYTDPTVEELKCLARKYITIFIQSDPDLFDPKAYNPEKLRRCIREIKLLSTTPVISVRKFDYPAENYSESELHAGKINFDLVGNVFFHLAAMEEQIDRHNLDNGYYKESASAFYNYRETAYVDNMLWLLDSMIKEHTRAKGLYIVQKHFWPEGQQAAVTLSHSVDDLRKWDLSSMILSVADDFIMLITFKWRQLIHAVTGKFRYLFTNYELYWNFEEFRFLERDSNCRSTFFIAAESCEDIDYALDDTDLQEEIQHILRSGNDIGLLATADKLNRDDFVTRKQIMLHQLHKEQIGIRQYGYKVNDTIRDLLNKTAPSYNQSTSYQEVPGFKHGFSIPWHPWIASMKASYMDLPTVYRDRYLYVNKHKILQLDDAKHQIKKFFQNSLRTRGIFGIDFSIASYADIHYCNKLYAYILALVKSSSTWVATAQEVASWWEKRARVTIDEGDYEISVYFPDDLEHMVLQVFNDAKLVDIDGVPAKIDGNLIKFANVKAGSIAVIRLNPNS
ncbi:MAG: hypothetical protein Q8M98_05250 [Candidatus Cloacimonadaceae bacterium]|nr:hypothetical protein [Candidatus Cloacimonadaceae bacterium]